MGIRQNRRQVIKVKNRGFIDLFAGLFIALCSIYLIACTMPRKGRIVKNTYVNHVNVSGLDQQEAARRIQKDFEKSYAYQSLTVEAAGNRYTVMINKSLEMDANAAAKAACDFAHGSFLTRGYGVLKAAIIKQRFSWNPHIEDKDTLKQAVLESGLMEVNTTAQTRYAIEGDELVFKKGVVGESVDLPALLDLLVKSVQTEDYVSVIDSPMIAGTVEKTDMEQVYKDVHATKRDATLDPENDYAIVESRRGIDFDVKNAQEAFDAAGEGAKVVIPLMVEKPDVTTADLEKRLFRDVLSEYTTEVTGSSGRKDNIERASDEIDGTILLAGESFSFNEVVGERTRKRGYTKASSYPEGWTEEVMGGGIAQVSSTLYMSALLSNLKIDERDNQKYVTGYIDKGCDADVSWDGQDFCFTNDTRYPVRIDISCSDGELEVVFKGSKLNKNTVEIRTKILEVYEHGTVYHSDRSLLAGKHVVMSSGVDGYKVQTYREIYDKKHKLISSKKEARSTYDSINSVVAEGTRKPKPKPKKEPDQKTPDQGQPAQAPSEPQPGNQAGDPNAGANTQ